MADNREADGQAPETLKVVVGARVKYKGAVGTVRFLGQLKHQGAEQWVGVQWDDASRGKHSGSHAGTHYFTSSVPNAASFVKASKLGSGGRSTFSQAARRRFEDALDRSHRDHTLVVGGGVVDIAEEGRLAERLSMLAELDVSDMGVAVITGVGDDVAASLPSLRYVRLAHSLFTCVRAVLRLMECLPHVQVMDVSHNKLGDDDVEEHMEGDVESRPNALTQLIVNHCITSWRGVYLLCRHARGIQELRLHNCGLRTMGARAPQLSASWQTLRILDLDGNQLSWADMGELSKLPHLRELYASHNGLPDSAGLPGATSAPFRRLETLSLAGNTMDGWRMISWLNRLPRLHNMRLRDNPICTCSRSRSSEYSWRQRAIGRLRLVHTLDGTTVSGDERLLADRRYTLHEIAPDVRTYGLPSVLESHPRAKELLRAHGDSCAHGEADLARTLRAHVVRVVLHAQQDMRAVRRTAWRWLPDGIAVVRLRAVARQVLRIAHGVRFEMRASCGGGGGEVSVLLEDGRDLGVLGKLDGECEVSVLCLPVSA